MNNCYLEKFGLDIFVDNEDCEHCPFKSKSKCTEAYCELVRRLLLNCRMWKDKKLTDKEEEVFFNTFKRGEIKKLLKEMGVKLA
jgi:hypothetical protein